MKYPKIGVILLNHNNFHHTKECIKSLDETQYPELYIYIVDNDSDDKYIPELLEFAKLHSKVKLDLLDDSYGFTKGNNIGLTHARTDDMDYLWVLGNDTVVAKDAPQLLLKTFTSFKLNPKTDNLSSIIAFYDVDRVWYNGLYDLPLVNFPKSIDKGKLTSQANQDDLVINKVRYGNGSCYFFSREFLDQHGYMDEDYYFYYDDLAFTKDANNFVLQKALIRHKVSATLGVPGKSTFTPFQAYWSGRNGIVFYFKDKKINIVEKLIYLSFTIWASAAMYIRSWNTLIEYLKGIGSGLSYVYTGKNHPYCTRKPRHLKIQPKYVQ